MRLLDFLVDYGEAVEESRDRRKAQQAELAKIRSRGKRKHRRR